MIPMRIVMDVEENPIMTKEELGSRLFPDDLPIVTALGVLTAGTDSGRPVVIVRIDLPDGKIVLGQTSLRLFQGASTAFAARYGVPGL